jgi:hypothetical protein
MDAKLKAAIEVATRRLLDQGMIVEAGWMGFSMRVVPKDASTLQRREMRLAFFAGAQHLFASIMTGLDEDKEPTDADLRRMDLINKELGDFAEQFKIKAGH